jgi:hypothetical protein
MKSDRLRLSRAKSVYTMQPLLFKAYKKRGFDLNCYYHPDGDDDGKAIKAGDVIYSAARTRSRSRVIFAHLACAMRMGIVFPEELNEKFISALAS